MIDQVWKKMIEENIAEYLSNIDFKKENFDINVMQEQLQSLCGVKPGINIKWDVKNEINELKKASGADNYVERIETPVEVEVLFVNENNLPIKIKFYI